MKAVYSLTEIIDYLKDIRKDHKNRSQKIIFLSEIFYKEKHELLNKEVHRILYVLVTGFDYFYNINPKDIKSDPNAIDDEKVDNLIDEALDKLTTLGIVT